MVKEGGPIWRMQLARTLEKEGYFECTKPLPPTQSIRDSGQSKVNSMAESRKFTGFRQMLTETLLGVDFWDCLSQV